MPGDEPAPSSDGERAYAYARASPCVGASARASAWASASASACGSASRRRGAGSSSGRRRRARPSARAGRRGDRRARRRGRRRRCPSPRRRLELRRASPSRPEPRAPPRAAPRAAATRAARGRPSASVERDARRRSRRRATAASIWDEISVRSARACAASIGADAITAHTPPVREAPSSKFFADRGTHLAAMIAYFALLSFVPLVFLALSLLGLVGPRRRVDFLVKELDRAFPTSSLDEHPPASSTRSRTTRPTLGIIGGVSLALVVALALQRARVGVQHRLRPAEPPLPAREGARGRSSWSARS